MSLIIIDSINGYMQSMPEERLLPIQVHELLELSRQQRRHCIMTLVQHGIFGQPVDEAAEVSYLADTVVLMRYFEVAGHRASGDFGGEKTKRRPRAHAFANAGSEGRTIRRSSRCRIPGRADRTCRDVHGGRAALPTAPPKDEFCRSDHQAATITARNRLAQRNRRPRNEFRR